MNELWLQGVGAQIPFVPPIQVVPDNTSRLRLSWPNASNLSMKTFIFGFAMKFFSCPCYFWFCSNCNKSSLFICTGVPKSEVNWNVFSHNVTPYLKLLFYLYFKIEHGGYYAPELAVTASNLVYVVVQSSTRLEPQPHREYRSSNNNNFWKLKSKTMKKQTLKNEELLST